MMRFFLVLAGFLLSACSHMPAPGERRAFADDLAARQGWRPEVLHTGRFNLLAYLPAQQIASSTLTVYIEGDGFAWISGTQSSEDPTPLDPLALRLALAQPTDNAAYLSRPCQYTGADAGDCPSRYWTEMRFAPEVIEASNSAIDIMKRRFGADKLVLVGYSGGGAVAALVAARRHDVTRVVTIAGNLDHRAWTAYHRIGPLTGSLNAADETDALRGIPQWHFAGAKDANITPAMVQSYADRFPEDRRPVVDIESGFDHHCCWAEHWPALWKKTQAH